MLDVQIDGLSKFQVLPGTTTFALEIRLFDDTGAAASAYELTLIAAGVGEVKAFSGDHRYRLVGTSSPSNDITTQIAVRQMAWPGGYVANGACYFKWNKDKGTVEAMRTETFPANIDLQQDDPTRFTLHLKSAGRRT